MNQTLAGSGEQESPGTAHVVGGSHRLLSSGLYRIGTTLIITGTQTQDPKTDTTVPAHRHVATQNTKCTKNFHKVYLKPGALLEPGAHEGGVQWGCFLGWQAPRPVAQQVPKDAHHRKVAKDETQNTNNGSRACQWTGRGIV